RKLRGHGTSVSVRPGTCPPDPVRCAHSAPAHCSSDPECPAEQKCCYNACRFRCVDPAEGTRAEGEWLHASSVQ
uniref:WAP domain-containing protein n=1 Tax=Pelusios castaneus TaxID=367368 RepID=A0A8C8S754_9SAUR